MSKSKCANSELLCGRIMVIGAGSAGNIFIRDISNNAAYKKCRIVCVIDDDNQKIGKSIYGVPIVGDRFSIIENSKKYGISHIVFAIPSCPANEKAEILNICYRTDCEIKTVPTISQLVDTQFSASDIRKVEIEDLLCREPIKIDLEKVMEYVNGKIVMITGGGGTIGSELCRQLARHKLKKLIIFDIYENSAYDIQNEIKRKYPGLEVVTLIGSVRDTYRLDAVFEKYRPQIVYHTAAHKHVPLMEDSPNESVKNNVIGTLNTVKAADKYGTERFVLISTDKAVNPTSIMGATKRICEMIIQVYNNRSKTEFSAVRFGNVLGSNGSVIPLFKRQIEEGGPVTVTHPDIIRYFMTISEAVSLVIQAGASAKGGEIFVLDMGNPVRIMDLAEKMIRLSGHIPNRDIRIVYTGLRPGEKLYEELLMSEEGLRKTENKLIYIGDPIDIDEEKLFEVLEELQEEMNYENNDIRALIRKIVPTYSRCEAECDLICNN